MGNRITITTERVIKSRKNGFFEKEKNPEPKVILKTVDIYSREPNKHSPDEKFRVPQTSSKILFPSTVIYVHTYIQNPYN